MCVCDTCNMLKLIMLWPNITHNVLHLPYTVPVKSLDTFNSMGPHDTLPTCVLLVYLCVYLYVYVCVFACLSVRVCVCVFVCVCVYSTSQKFGHMGKCKYCKCIGLDRCACRLYVGSEHDLTSF